MTHPIWLAPDVSIDDVVAGLVTAATWWNLRECRPARITGVRGWLIFSETEETGSKRTFHWHDDDPDGDGVPLCGRFGLFVGARLDVDSAALAVLRRASHAAWHSPRDDSTPIPRWPLR